MSDAELDQVAAWLLREDPRGERFAIVLRKTLDQLYDGQHTGRYRWAQLYKTEKTHCGSLVEINLQRAFRFDNGERMDYRIAGFEVDCKYSQTLGRWMIPREAVGHLCLLVWADDQQSKWSVGLIRIDKRFLNKGNQDLKRTINSAGCTRIRWLFNEKSLPPNGP